MMNVQSVKDKLKNYAIRNNQTLQDILIMYGLERAIYRISKSEYSNNFTLKGGILLYALFDGDFARATTDVDLHAKGLDNDVQKIKEIFLEIFAIEKDDALVFDLKSLEVTLITEFKEYHGVNVSIMAYLDRTRLRVTMDIGFGDIIYPKRVPIEFPAILDMDEAKLYAYSIYTVVSEKFEAFVQLGYANSRYKDFYDIYILATSYDFDGDILKKSVEETFTHRNTQFDDIVAFENDFSLDKNRQLRWNSFIKKKKAMINVEFDLVIDLIKKFLSPVVYAITNETQLNSKWSSSEKKWIY
ncbi:MAG: nucleotidyl transferase AbiEii/AbiGii toxin family protein [Eubacteriales bacterium]